MLLVFLFFCSLLAKIYSKFKRFEKILEAKNPENDPVGLIHRIYSLQEAYRGTNLIMVYSFPSLPSLPEPFRSILFIAVSTVPKRFR
jgi:hypothetical protein